MRHIREYWRSRTDHTREYAKGMTALVTSAVATLALYAGVSRDPFATDATVLKSATASSCTDIEKVKFTGGKPDPEKKIIQNIGATCIGLHERGQGPDSPMVAEIEANAFAEVDCLVNDTPFAAGFSIADGSTARIVIGYVTPTTYDQFAALRAELPEC